jgi:hypothetical protein
MIAAVTIAAVTIAAVTQAARMRRARPRPAARRNGTDRTEPHQLIERTVTLDLWPVDIIVEDGRVTSLYTVEQM